MKIIHPLSLSQANFAPFGQVISFAHLDHYPINQGTTERYHAISEIDVGDDGSKAIISLFRGQPFAIPFTLRLMERHPLGTQTFIPTNNQSNDQYLIVVSKPNLESEADIVNNLCAFIASNGTGITYNKGVWHHPLISLNKESDFIVIDRARMQNNCDEIQLSEEVIIESL